MSNQHIVYLFIIFMQKLKEPETRMKWQLIIIVSWTRCWAVAKRPLCVYENFAVIQSHI